MSVVKFGDVVREVKINIDRSADDHEFFIAGEHMDSNNIHITRRGKFSESDVGPAFTRLFRPGQVLYGSRRTYLRKVAVADFEGITSNTTFVLETKDNRILMQELLPYIMLTESFSDYAIKNSKGSTNPYILFKDLAAYQFDLPSIEEQCELVGLLGACDRAKEAYKRLLKQTDELVKSQFIEMFGDADDCRFEVSTIGDTCKLKSGTTFPADKEQAEGDFLYAKVSDMNLPGNELYIRSSKSQVSAATAGNTPIPAGSVIFPKRGGAIGTNKKRILSDDTCVDLNTMGVIPGERLLTEYLYQFFLNLDLLSLADGSAIPQLNNRQIAPVKIVVPPIDLQKEFKELFQQSDKSKFELKQAIDRIDEMIRALMKD